MASIILAISAWNDDDCFKSSFNLIKCMYLILLSGQCTVHPSSFSATALYDRGHLFKSAHSPRLLAKPPQTVSWEQSAAHIAREADDFATCMSVKLKVVKYILYSSWDASSIDIIVAKMKTHIKYWNIIALWILLILFSFIGIGILLEYIPQQALLKDASRDALHKIRSNQIHFKHHVT